MNRAQKIRPGFWPKKEGSPISGDGHTVYIVIPAEQISTYLSVLRVMLGQPST